METICGSDCNECYRKDICPGCMATEGHPLGGDCVAANCCHSKGKECCAECCPGACEQISKLITEINSLHIKDMPEIVEIYEINGELINLEYTLPNGELIKFWNDTDIYWGTQVKKQNSEKNFGIAANQDFLLICEYYDEGAEPEIVIYKKREN